MCDASLAALHVLRVCILHASAIAVCMCACSGTLCLGRLALLAASRLLYPAVTEHSLFLEDGRH